MKRVSEARLNDLCYLTLKRLFFQPAGLPGPRGCDIRICMDLTARERIKGIEMATLYPGEKAGQSHDIFYDIDLQDVLINCQEYMEDHWFKAPITEVSGNPDIQPLLQQDFDQVVDIVMALKEEDCCATA